MFPCSGVMARRSALLPPPPPPAPPPPPPAAAAEVLAAKTGAAVGWFPFLVGLPKPSSDRGGARSGDRCPSVVTAHLPSSITAAGALMANGVGGAGVGTTPEEGGDASPPRAGVSSAFKVFLDRELFISASLRVTPPPFRFFPRGMVARAREGVLYSRWVDNGAIHTHSCARAVCQMIVSPLSF
jgi:hypothetical protein